MKSLLWHERILCGTEEFWVPAVLAAVSAGGQAVNSANANSRAQNAEIQGIQQQQQYREQANSQVKALTQQINTNTPQQLANQEQSQFVNTLRSNEAGSAAGGSTGTNQNTFGQPVSALPQNITGASKQYQNSANASQKQTQQYGNTEAGEMSAIDSAVRQRQNEGLAMQTLGTNLNLLGGESGASGFVNQLRAQTAGQQSPWASLFSGILGGVAKGASQNGLPWNTPSSNTNVWYTPPTQAGGGFLPMPTASSP
jgi:hypothetical protein